MKNDDAFLRGEPSEIFSLKNIGYFYLRRLVRLIPFNLFMIMFGMFIIPNIGGGPIWYTYDSQVVAQCRKYWWTNALFINNFYPAKFEDKCMGWNWFIPVYV